MSKIKDKEGGGKKRKLVRHILPDTLVREALKYFYRRKSPYVDFYLQWRLVNSVIPVRKEISDEFIKLSIDILSSLDDKVYDYEYKKAIGAYILFNICPKLTYKSYHIKNSSDKIIYRKV